MKTVLLSDEAVRATYTSPMRDVTEVATDVVDIWPYVSAFPSDELQGYEVYDQFVEHDYRDAADQFDHVLVMTKSKNVYVVIVVDLICGRIQGHHVLDLNEKYGLGTNGE